MPDIRDLLIGVLEERNIGYQENDLNEILHKNLLKKGFQLLKCDQEWERVNEDFRDTLSKDIDFNDLETQNYAHSFLEQIWHDIYIGEQGNHNLSKTQLKKVLKVLKSQNPPPLDKIKHVSKLLRQCYNKNEISNDNINHQKFCERNF